MTKRMIERNMSVEVDYQDKDGIPGHHSYDWEDLKFDGLNFNELISDYFADDCKAIKLTIISYDT